MIFHRRVFVSCRGGKLPRLLPAEQGSQKAHTRAHIRRQASRRAAASSPFKVQTMKGDQSCGSHQSLLPPLAFSLCPPDASLLFSAKCHFALGRHARPPRGSFKLFLSPRRRKIPIGIALKPRVLTRRLVQTAAFVVGFFFSTLIHANPEKKRPFFFYFQMEAIIHNSSLMRSGTRQMFGVFFCLFCFILACSFKKSYCGIEML